jgi:NADPH:quinone reductase-like Zn-dependent oxidoreductase
MVALSCNAWLLVYQTPGIGAGRVAAVIDQELPMSQAAQAHRAVAASDHIGKILLRPE